MDTQLNTVETGFTLVLDLDQTLIYGEYIQDISFPPINTLITIPGQFTTYNEFTERIQSYSIIGRPGLKKFLNICCKVFDHIVVWSTNCENYVEIVTKFLFKELDNKPLAIWSFKDRDEYKSMYIKPLSKLVKKFTFIDINKTLIIDDRKSSFSIKDLKNSILIPAYETKNNTDNCLDILGKWLSEIPKTTTNLANIPKPKFTINK